MPRTSIPHIKSPAARHRCLRQTPDSQKTYETPLKKRPLRTCECSYRACGQTANTPTARRRAQSAVEATTRSGSSVAAMLTEEGVAFVTSREGLSCLRGSRGMSSNFLIGRLRWSVPVQRTRRAQRRDFPLVSVSARPCRLRRDAGHRELAWAGGSRASVAPPSDRNRDQRSARARATRGRELLCGRTRGPYGAETTSNGQRTQ